ncbi:hypothetical protein APTSU1_001336000 [Apodemus speciosus]|uniref:Uncharacterized protein n=1 Tax=Apodemus speciosus TaxID=105296 RepID=A0ABQ0FFV8_APOSI
MKLKGFLNRPVDREDPGVQCPGARKQGTNRRSGFMDV